MGRFFVGNGGFFKHWDYFFIKREKLQGGFGGKMPYFANKKSKFPVAGRHGETSEFGQKEFN